jgi:hypothetical protein
MPAGDDFNKATFPKEGVGYRLPLPLYNDELYVCVLCGLVDAPIYAGEADMEQGRAKFIHRVTLDVVFLKSDTLTAKDKAEGFVLIRVENRPAKVRAICRDCLEQDEQTQLVWKDFEKVRREFQENSKEPSFYAVLCQE